MPVFEWDERKRLSNIEKHGIDFKACLPVFLDTRSFELRSDRGGEQRCLLVGSLNDRIVAVIFTIRGQKIRIISAHIADETLREKWKASANTS